MIENTFFDETCEVRGAFTLGVSQTVFVRGTCDLFNLMCKQHHRNA